MLVKAPIPTGVMAASAPPPMATSQRPRGHQPGRGGHRVGAGRAGRGDGLAGAVPAGAHGDVGGPGVGHHHGDEEGRDPPGPLFQVDGDLLLERVEAADAGAEDDPGPVRVGADLAGVVHGHVGGGHRELGEAVHTADSLGPNQADGSKSGTRCSPSGPGRLSPSQKSSRPMPQQARTPMPVMTTRRPCTGPSGPTPSSIRAWRRSGCRPGPPSRCPRARPPRR